MRILETLEQGTQEWHDVRLGRVTASHFRDVLSKGKARGEYMARLADELITGEYQPIECNPYMAWGTAYEPQARQEYIKATGNEVKEVGFIIHDEHVGVSPDGLVGDDGMLEIKCPTTKTHHKNLRMKSCPSNYKAQVQGQMWVAGRKWVDFVSYDPRYKEYPLHIVRVERDEDYIERIRKATDLFIDELMELTKNTKINRETNLEMEAEMPTINDLKTSKFLKKEDVDPAVPVTITGYSEQNVALESQEPEMKWCLEFAEMDKPLVLNQTNGIAISAYLGSEDFDDWTGKKIVLFNDTTIMYAGKRTGGIRVKPAVDDGVPI